MARWTRFLLALAAGAALGLLYGWLISPVQYTDTTPDTLRVDYRSDYVLMAAEAFSTESDPALAVRRLAVLGDDPPAEIVRQAILWGERNGFVDSDVSLMRNLLAALEGNLPLLRTPAP